MEIKADVTYGMVKQTYCLGDKERTVYGIAAYTANDINAVSEAVYGISKEKEPVEELILLCNRLELSPIHLKDVAEDLVFAQNFGQYPKNS